MNNLLTCIFYLKNNLLGIFINFIVLYYTLKLSLLNKFILLFILAIALLLFIIILFYKEMNVKYKVFIILFCFIIYSITRFDSRYLIVTVVCITFWKEDISLYFNSMFITSVFSLLVTLIIGYSHINGLSILLGICVFLYFLTSYKLSVKMYLLVLFLLNIILFLFIKSGQSIICINFCAICIFLLQFDIPKKIIHSKFWIFIFPFAAFINIYFSLSLHSNGLLYINSILPNFINNFIDLVLVYLDRIMSYRLSLSNISLHVFGFKYYGNTLNYNDLSLNGAYFNVDSGYLQILQGQGLIIFISVLLFLTLIVYYFYSKNNFTMIVISISLALWCVNEDIIMSVGLNIVWIFLAPALSYFIDKIKQKFEVNEYGQ